MDPSSPKSTPNEEIRDGMARATAMMPPVATAPAPM
jgi:hypothetical protein